MDHLKFILQQLQAQMFDKPTEGIVAQIGKRSVLSSFQLNKHIPFYVGLNRQYFPDNVKVGQKFIYQKTLKDNQRIEQITLK